MIPDNKIIALAKKTMDIEASSVLQLKRHIGSDFVRCVRKILETRGRVIVTGIGKSANIANKIVATLNSTGTPSLFLHAADAIHGDLGVVQKGDIVVCLSKSGDTPEIKALVPLLKITGNPIIALVGNIRSFLARHADYVLNATVKQEACPYNLAPTSSTTVQLALGDALALCLMYARGFTYSDFAKFHPGGTLGKKLYLTAADLCARNPAPQVDKDSDIRSVIMEISSRRLGATAVMNNGKLAGVITDGDLRRMLEKNISLNALKAKNIMTHNPKTVSHDTLAVKALEVMEQYKITQVLVMDKDRYMGIVHMHDIIKEGIM